MKESGGISLGGPAGDRAKEDARTVTADLLEALDAMKRAAMYQCACGATKSKFVRKTADKIFSDALELADAAIVKAKATGHG